MKTKIKTTAQLILVATLVFAACKKKEDTNSTNNGTTSTTGTTTGAPVVVKTMTASVNNVNWQVTNNGGYSIASTNIQYSFSGQTNFSPNPNTAISFNLPRPISAGTYTFSSSGPVQAYYKDSSGVFFTSNAGNINITQIDTTSPANGTFTKLKATFNFTTGVVSSKSYTVNNGTIDYTK